MLAKDQKIILHPQSQIYNKPYPTSIISLEDSTFKVKMPLDKGKLVLLSVGTMLKIETPQNQAGHFISEVMQRIFTPEPALVLTLPLSLLAKRFSKKTRFISVTSGKGGVGKTSFTINLAISLSQLGYRTFVIDADLGTANIDVLLNLQPKYNLTHILKRDKELLDIIIDGPGGIHLIPGGSGLEDLADLDEYQFNRLINSFQILENFADIVLIDTGAGLSKNVINFLLASDDIIVVITPEPHAITDAYALIKVLNEKNCPLRPKLVLNRVENFKEAQQVAAKIIKVTERFLTLKLDNLGYILDDHNVLKAIKQLRPFILTEPQSPASRCIKNIARAIVKHEENIDYQINKSFFHRVKELFSR